jgi:hypothetical protein
MDAGPKSRALVTVTARAALHGKPAVAGCASGPICAGASFHHVGPLLNIRPLPSGSYSRFTPCAQTEPTIAMAINGGFDLTEAKRQRGASPAAHGTSRKEPAIGDGCQSREVTPHNVSRFAGALCVAIPTHMGKTLQTAWHELRRGDAFATAVRQ